MDADIKFLESVFKVIEEKKRVRRLTASVYKTEEIVSNVIVKSDDRIP